MQIAYIKSLPANKVKLTLVENLNLVIPLSVALSWHLKPGLVLDDRQWQQLAAESKQTSLLNLALSWASLRPRSEHEFSLWARKHQVTDSEPIGQKLRSLGLLNDAKFAAWWADNRATFRPRSKLELSMELRSKGVSAQDIAATLSSVDETSLVRVAARKYFKKLISKPSHEQRQKLLAYLGRRGFNFSTSRQIVDEILSDN